uniref:Uncharacterized protein n=1 Tax=Cucumis melo TaxID=3656 RepID=A0A9I9E595_CUCME
MERRYNWFIWKRLRKKKKASCVELCTLSSSLWNSNLTKETLATNKDPPSPPSFSPPFDSHHETSSLSKPLLHIFACRCIAPLSFSTYHGCTPFSNCVYERQDKAGTSPSSPSCAHKLRPAQATPKPHATHSKPHIHVRRAIARATPTRDDSLLQSSRTCLPSSLAKPLSRQNYFWVKVEIEVEERWRLTRSDCGVP